MIEANTALGPPGCGNPCADEERGRTSAIAMRVLEMWREQARIRPPASDKDVGNSRVLVKEQSSERAAGGTSSGIRFEGPGATRIGSGRHRPVRAVARKIRRRSR